MKISCLTVTQLQRLHLLRRCLWSYSRQTVDSSLRELLLVHHDGHEATRAIQKLLTEFTIDARIFDVPRAPLGKLRNISIENASGELLCQWDDDDIYHPNRLFVQSLPFVEDSCIATALSTQLLWFCEKGDLYIRRGSKDGIRGTVMFRNGLGLQYDPTMSRGEDSRLMQDLLAYGPSSVHPIDDHPELYVRTYHGLNTWEFEHYHKHTQRAVTAEWLKQNEATIRGWIKILQLGSVRVRDAYQIAFTV
jgi:glycosyltransferase involved in cell wall biosynthesis